MTRSNARLMLVLIWIGWAVVIIGFQTLVDARMQPDRPDYALEWTIDFTARNSQKDIAYLTEPFMNRQVSMDSEYYLSIAAGGYDDPAGRSMTTRGGRNVNLNYAFFPLYPLVIRGFMLPLSVFGLTTIATATLAGSLLSILGTLGGMFALYDLTRDELDEAGGLRTAFYMLIFPSGFFLAQVFTEGLFVGLAFGCLALARRKHLLLAGVLAFFATLTRAAGLALIAPLAIAWLSQFQWQTVWIQARGRFQAVNWRTLPIQKYVIGALAILLPLAAYLLWKRLYGTNFTIVEEGWFGRQPFDFEKSSEGWKLAIEQILNPDNFQRRVYFMLEAGSILLALIASLFTLRRYPGVALFGLVALVPGLTSGYPQSLIRYVLAIPAIFIFLSRLGKNQAFDRVWSIASVLTMGMLLTLFTWDMWVA